MKIFLSNSSPAADSMLLSALEEVFGDGVKRSSAIVRRGTPDETRARIKAATAVFGVWSQDDPLAVGEIAFASGVGRPVYVVASSDDAPWFCTGIGQGGSYPSALRAVAAFLRDVTASRSAE